MNYIVNLLYIKTFLEITVTRSFLQAGKNLNIAQSTVSARVNMLEQSLGYSLFERSRAGFDITAGGLQFQKHALNMMRAWEQAQQPIGLDEEGQSVYRICVQMNLWEKLISHWIPWMKEKESHAILKIESDYSSVMMNQLAEGLLDIGVMYTPRQVQGLNVEQLLEEQLVMVSSHAQCLAEVEYKSYVLVHWGEAFLHMHNQAFSALSKPPMSVGLPPIALQQILDWGGSAYQSLGAVQNLIDNETLFLVKDAPVYPRPVFIVYSDESNEKRRLDVALDGLRYVASLA